MKKLIYIVLIAILLVLVGKYAKDKREESTAATRPVVIVEEEDFNVDIVDPVTGEVIGTSEGNIVTTTTYDDNEDNADGMVAEENEEGDIIEENPELTQDYDETIIAE